MTAETRVSAVQRVLGLPDAFSLNLCATLLGIEKGVATVYLSRWSAAGYVKASGPRTGFYFNVLKSRDSPAERLTEAILHVHPTAMVRGATVLHATGMTTQVPHQIDVAVLAPANRAHTTGFEERPKSRRWYAAMQGMKLKDGLFGLPALSPEAALADLYATPGDWHPDVDDLEVDELDWLKFGAACNALGIAVPQQLVAQMAQMALVADAAASTTPAPAKRRVARFR